jgi:hypothetical protein
MLISTIQDFLVDINNTTQNKMSGCDVTGEKSHTRGFPLVKL